ncbi:hypothetical protein WEI85_10400 [Actinomycetes bacterium KLBMP 9797]
MSNLRREMAGAWRSLRYDLARRPVPEAGEPTTAARYPEYRPRRRLLAATVCGVLSVAGAAGAYFGVTGGLSALAGDDPAGRPDALPAVAAPSPSVAVPHQPGATVAAAPSPVNVRDTRRPSPRPTKPGPAAPNGAPAPSPSCACETPPVPRPTSLAPSPSASPEPSVTPPDSPSPSPDPSGGPGDPPPAGR